MSDRGTVDGADPAVAALAKPDKDHWNDRTTT